MPHGMCYVWRPDILGLHVASDALIALSYFSIPIALYYFLRNRPDVPFRAVIYMFSVFIFACGLTHLMGIWIVWNGHYGIQGILKAITALASIATAITLFPVIPKLLALRTPQELEESNHALQSEIETRKQEEVKAHELQNDLAHMGRLSTVGQMATGLAHELNQPLMAISQSADTALLAAQEVNTNDPDLVECLEDIQSETQRAGEIIRALRQLVSNETSTRSEVDIAELAEQVVKFVKPEGRSNNIIVSASTTGHVMPVINRIQIAQVLVNLVRNGIQAIADAGRLSGYVTVKTEQTDDRIRVTVEDNGPGIDSNVELFKPFTSSKADGMGMGLSISRTIIESHGGTLVAENMKGSGARFIFSLPLAING